MKKKKVFIDYDAKIDNTLTLRKNESAFINVSPIVSMDETFKSYGDYFSVAQFKLDINLVLNNSNYSY